MASLEKELMYKEIEDRLVDKTVFFTSFEKIAVNDFETLRKGVRAKSVDCFVAKKTLLKRYFSQKNVSLDDAIVNGPMLVMTSDDQMQDLAKEIVQLSKTSKLDINGMFLEGAVEGKATVVELSKLPSRHELLGKVVSTINAPIANTVCVLSGVIKSLAVVINELKNKKEAA